MDKILHLIPDEKVTDNVIENFESIFDNNVFFVLGDDNNRKYCKSERSNVIFGEEIFFSKENVDQDVTAVIVHGLNYIFAKLILQLAPKIKIAWFAWGFDIYNLPKIIDKIYAPKSLEYLRTVNPNFNAINIVKKKKVLRGFYYRYINKTDDFYTIYEQAYDRIDFFCSYIREDYEVFKKFYTNTLKYHEIGYFSINQYLVGQLNLKISDNAKNVLVGNSNSLENNHLDVFSFLEKYTFQGKVIVPLSYGNDDQYKKSILLNGDKTLGEKFYPLLNFMGRENYLHLMSGCSVAIFYHYRQQAMGNILALLYMGVRVYLSKKNPVYHYLLRIGVAVFSLENEFSLYLNAVLEKDKQDLNRIVLDRIFREDILKLQYSDLINKLTHKCL